MADRITVTELVNDIKSNLSQKSASRKDEIKVMQAMLNDTSYEVNIYGKDGAEGVYTLEICVQTLFLRLQRFLLLRQLAL